MTRLVRQIVAALVVASGAWCAAAAQPLEAFVRQPEIIDAAMSPNGERIAIIGHTEAGNPYVLVRAVVGESGGFEIPERYRLDRIEWVGDRHVALVVRYNETFEWTPTGTRLAQEIKYEVRRTLIVKIDDMSAEDAFSRGTQRIGRNFDLADIVAIDHDNARIYIAAFSRVGSYDLYSIDVETFRTEVVENGSTVTRGWLVDDAFQPLARIDYGEASDRFVVFAYRDGSPVSIVDERAAIPTLGIFGMNEDGTSLVVGGRTNTYGLYSLGLSDGAIAPMFATPEYDVEGASRDPYSRRVVGAYYADEDWRTSWFDDELGDVEAALQEAFADRKISLVSWDRARERYILAAESNDATTEYYYFDAAAGQADSIGLSYPELAPFGLLSQREPMRYAAHDGTSIPAYLTTPEDASGPLPLVVLPYGGPESRDVGGFDWMAHLFASRGFLVLQPNFRGSTGYGTNFRNAGRGEWGGLMQDDVTDGVQHLIDAGLVDPGRICIVGWSYGGYAALAGAAKTPDLYSCVVAIAPVTDLPEQIRYAKDRYGSRNWVVAYWTNVIGDVREDNAQLVAASPSRRARDILAPVLLVHGAEDTTVPIDQSETMRAALRRADRDVELVALSGDDHDLYRPATRLAAMTAVVEFLDAHLL